MAAPRDSDKANPSVSLQDLQDRIGISFDNVELLKQALTHRSYIHEQMDENLDDNERLEFLGDAILDFLTAEMLYDRFPGMAEGEMTRLRAALVRTDSLARLATDCSVGQAMLMGKGEARNGGRERSHNLCNGFEALIGAIFLEKGLETVRAFVIPRLTELQKDVMEEALRKDPRSQFQEWAQAIHAITPEYRLVGTHGPDHEKVFEVSVSLGHFLVAAGQGRSKRSAAQAAASAALARKDNGELDTIPAPDPEPEPDLNPDANNPESD